MSCLQRDGAQGGTIADSSTAMDHGHPVAPSTTSAPPLKEVYREQFLSAMQLISRELSKGTRKTDVLDLLKQQGMKTRTGREWTYTILISEIRRLGDTHEQETAGGQCGSFGLNDGDAEPEH